MIAFIDLRSDTVTKPTPGMRKAMADAEVGDDVYGEDPVVNRLQERVAVMLGKEAGLFVPSGTQSNQIAIRVHTRPGDEILCETSCHIYTWEAGGPAVLSGVTCRPIEGDYGQLEVEDLQGKVRPDNEHYVRTRLVCLENTHNRGGGRVIPLPKLRAISDWAIRNGLARHLDGARLWNATVASGIPLKDWADCFDTVSVCFSKGLGAPLGSMLLGPKAFIAEARRIRKLFGGGMRQAGIVAAAADYALDHHFNRMEDDHANAKLIAEAVQATPGLTLERPPVETNLVWFKVDPGKAEAVVMKLKERGTLVSQLSPGVLRACTHLDVSRDQALAVAKAIRGLALK